MKALALLLGNIRSPEKAGFPPPPGSLLTGFVGHKSRHLPVRVPVPYFAERFTGQVSEYQ